VIRFALRRCRLAWLLTFAFVFSAAPARRRYDAFFHAYFFVFSYAVFKEQ
jgi:hypothetical protein